VARAERDLLYGERTFKEGHRLVETTLALAHDPHPTSRAGGRGVLAPEHRLLDFERLLVVGHRLIQLALLLAHASHAPQRRRHLRMQVASALERMEELLR
jgi:hypothetical protein